MTGRVFALLVGIDSYRASPPLRGCGNDVAQVAEFLRVRVPAQRSPSVLALVDHEATRDRVVAGLRDHLGQAGSGDTALFWFSGHGSRAAVPGELWHLEPSGQLQTLVCYDSRHGDVPDLYDKEVSLLLGEVAARDCHVVAVLDSCHSHGATRNVQRSVPDLTTPPAVGALLPELRLAATRAPVEHVLLAACRSSEVATEEWLDGAYRGLFSWALMAAMHRLGPAATYRELLAAARCEVERYASRQVPKLDPVTPGIVDQPFLGGRIRPPASGMWLRAGQGCWEIDAGACHGIPTRVDGNGIRVAVAGTSDEARIVRVDPDRSVVEPVGWEPDEDVQYPVVLSRVPVPEVVLAVEEAAGPTIDVVMAALAASGPTGGPSPYVRPFVGAGEADSVELRLRAEAPDRVSIRDRDDVPLCADFTGVHGDGGRRVVAALEHLAQVRLVRTLVNPVSRLTGAVSLQLVEARPTDVTAPAHRPALLPGADGAIVLRYHWEHGRWVAPTVFVRLHNDSGRPLHVVLLNVTQRHRVHAGLFPGEDIAPGSAGAALYGRPVEFRLPAGVPVEPGAHTRDLLILLAAEEEFSAAPFELPALDEVGTRRTRAPLAVTGLLGRLGLAAVHRDAGAAGTACDWLSLALTVVTEVPGSTGLSGVGRSR
ncbi:caspase family protein [Micromonospora wenchangensis]|uniref:caspase family protein n=1 Tax=Micromonospora wenchangensis TaxID=1185415 RepID=UPI0011836CCE|nr:caspase family protein [Micromonospora wenchangensis]